MSDKRHALVCHKCHTEIAELLPDEVGPGHHLVEEYPKENLYTGIDLCFDCEDEELFGEEEGEDE